MSHVHYMNQSVPFWDFVESLEQQGARPNRPGQQAGVEQVSRPGRGRGGRRGGFRGGRGQGFAAKRQALATEKTDDSSDNETPIMTPATPLNEKSLESEQTDTTDTETEKPKRRGGKMGRGRGRGLGRGRGAMVGPIHGGISNGFRPQRPMMGPLRHLAEQNPQTFRGGFGGRRGRAAFPMVQRFNRGSNAFNLRNMNEALDSCTSGDEKKPRRAGMPNKAGVKKPGMKKAGMKAGKKAGKMNKNGNKKKGMKKVGDDEVAKKFDFHPLADHFNTPDSHVIHVALPGGKREDVTVVWRPKKGFLVMKGTVARPGDAEFLQTLKKGERNVGTFKRRVRLGRPGKPAKVDAEHISTTLENGILKVVVPKKKKTEKFVDLKDPMEGF